MQNWTGLAPQEISHGVCVWATVGREGGRGVARAMPSSHQYLLEIHGHLNPKFKFLVTTQREV